MKTTIETLLINKNTNDYPCKLLIANVKDSYHKRFWIKSDGNPFKELHCSGRKYGNYTDTIDEEIYELKDIENDISYTLYKSNNNWFIKDDFVKFMFLKESKDISGINIDDLQQLPSNVFNIGLCLHEANNENIYYILCYRAYNSLYINNIDRVFYKFDLSTKSYIKYRIETCDVYRDGGTTNIVLFDNSNNIHHFHWDTKFKNENIRHNTFDNIELIDVNPSEELINQFYNINSDIIFKLK